MPQRQQELNAKDSEHRSLSRDLINLKEALGSFGLWHLWVSKVETWDTVVWVISPNSLTMMPLWVHLVLHVPQAIWDQFEFSWKMLKANEEITSALQFLQSERNSTPRMTWLSHMLSLPSWQELKHEGSAATSNSEAGSGCDVWRRMDQ